jgi:putative PIN family toxin of toxin-antitoxin system
LRVVLDTNVLVSGLLAPFGPPGVIVRMVVSGALILCVDARVLLEYHDVLRRPRFNFDEDAIAALMDYIEATSDTAAAVPLAKHLPDADDEAFLEVAIACAARYLVTGNLDHFPGHLRAGVSVVSPREFVELYRLTGTQGEG